MSNTFAAWLHVTPSPTTLAESSAVYQALSKHGRISAFIRSTTARRAQEEDSNGTSTFYTVFPHEPPGLQRTFQVPVYHDLPIARDEDPFNIRGLQNRKPMPAPKTFTCLMEVADRSEVKSQEEAMTRENPYHGHFKVQKNDWLWEALSETNAPPGVPKGCATRILEDVNNIDAFTNSSEGVTRPAEKPTRRKINMRSLREMWKEAKEEQRRRETVTPKRLSANTPIGML